MTDRERKKRETMREKEKRAKARDNVRETY